VRARPALLAPLALALAVSGCGSGATVADGPAPSSPGDVGLEVSWWVVRDPDAEHVGRVLASSASNPVPAPPTQVLQWWSAGLRVVGVDADRLDGLLAALRVTPPVQRARMGTNPRWGVLAAGVPWSGARTLDVGGEALRLPAGRLRLLVRSWIAPAGDPAHPAAARLRVDLVPQHVGSADTEDPESVRRRLGLTPRLRAAEEGLCFERLALELELADGAAVLLVPDLPGHAWSGWDPPAGAAPPADDLGPFAPAAPDLGGLVLTDWSNPSGAALRVIVVLRAHVPPRFELFPR